PVGPEGTLIPGDFAGGMPLVALSPAPAIGPVLEEPEQPPTFEAGAPASGHVEPIAPFEGLKVLDLAWVVAGPAIGRVLADYGATVVRVESSRRVDTARLMGPFPDGAFDRDRSACYETYNTGKLGLALDLAREEARAVVRDLVAWADVLVESFAPGQMERWGLGYEALRAIKPDLVMVSTSLMGQTGPYAPFAGFGNIGAAMSGFQALVGWPDALPIGPFGPYTDYVGPRFGLAALLATLHRRRITGAGAWLDISQAEAGMQFLAAEIAEHGATGSVARAIGNRAASMAPHGVFPGAGEDRWVAIVARDDAEWAVLAGLIGGAAAQPHLATVAGRKAHEDELERLVGEWTRGRTVEAIEAALQDAGLPAHVVASSADMVRDPQLVQRGQFVRLKHERGGESVVEASRFRLSATPAAYRRTAPSFGRDNVEVLEQLLGYDAARIEQLAAAGILT
ncbi:MAG: CaiB/BaiF CoA transferase family protein, partial [Janthinobacterium lividum]